MLLNAYTARKPWRRWVTCVSTLKAEVTRAHTAGIVCSSLRLWLTLWATTLTVSLTHLTAGPYTSHCWAFLIWEHDLTAQELSSLSHMKADRSSTSGIPFLSRAPSWLHCVHSCVTPPPSDFRIFLPPQGREPPYLFWSLHILSSPPQTSSRLLCRLSGSGFTV